MSTNNELKLIDVDFTDFEEIVKRAKENPKKAAPNASLNDLRLMAYEASNDVYQELRRALDGNEDAQRLLFVHSHLLFFFYQFNDITVSDIDVVRKELSEVWPRLATI